MLSTQKAWLTMIAAVLGVDATACQKVSPQASPAGSAEITPVPSAVAATAPPSASVANTDIVVAADASVIDSGKPVKVARAVDSGINVGSLDSVFSNQDFPNNELDRLAQSSCGASTQSNDLRLGGTHGIGGLGSLLGDGGTSAQLAPHGDATVTVVSGAVGTDTRIVAGMRPGFRLCYNTSITQDPSTPDGRVTLSVVVAPNGDVTSSNPTSSTVPAVTQCVARRAMRASFDAQAAPRTLVVTVDLKKAP